MPLLWHVCTAVLVGLPLVRFRHHLNSSCMTGSLVACAANKYIYIHLCIIVVVALLLQQKLIPRIYWHMPALHGASHFYRLRAGCYVEDHMTCEACGITHDSLLEIISSCTRKGELSPEVSLLLNSTPPPSLREFVLTHVILAPGACGM